MTLIFSQSKLSASKWKHKHLDSAEVTIWGVTGGGGEICAGILNLPGKIFITNTRDKRAVAVAVEAVALVPLFPGGLPRKTAFFLPPPP